MIQVIQPDGKAEVSFHLTTVTAAEARFLGEVMQLFCDPARAGQLAAVKGCQASICYSEATGLFLIPIINHPNNAKN